MIHIKVFRETPDIIIENLKKKHDIEKIKWVENVIEWDKQLRVEMKELDKLRARRNEVSKKINENVKKGADVSFLIDEVKVLPEEIKQSEQRVDQIKQNILKYQMRIPNILHETVPFGNTDEDNAIIKTWGEVNRNRVESHSDWIIEKDYVDIERAAKIAGARTYIMKGKLFELAQALMKYSVDIVKQHGFTPMSVPYFVRQSVEQAATDLEDFKEVIYKIEGEDLYLVPTSEPPLLGMYMDEKLDVSEPLKYAGYSTCFRKEAGSHGKDTKGIFRVHQFNKVEMFIFCKPEDSWALHEKMLEIEEQIVQGLNIPYRIVNVCTGDIGIVAAKKYDIEVWMPSGQTYRELMSCSNCTDYQSVRANIKDLEGNYIHTLNATALPDTRTLVAIIENYIENGKVKVPEVLKKYVDFEEL